MYIRFLVVVVLLFTGCTGGEEAPQASPEEVDVAPAATPQQVETTAPPPTAPPPWAYLFSSSTLFLDAMPSDYDKTQPLTDDDYNFVLKFPSKTADYEDGARFSYKIPTSGTIYVMKFQSATGAAEFLEFALNKIEKSEETVTEETLTRGGQSLNVYHRTEYVPYFGTLVQKGVFIYYLQMYSNSYDTESYIAENMDYLFVPDIEEETSGAAAQLIEADFSSPETSPTDVIPQGATIETISKNDYEYRLEFPEETASYDTGIKASYTTPSGNIYVMRFKSIDGAEDFYSGIISRFQRGENVNAFKVVLTADGKSLEAHNKVKGSNYVATITQKGVFIYYVKMGNDQFESESYIKSSMIYLFE